jgi:ribosomal protein L11 methyltransferase
MNNQISNKFINIVLKHDALTPEEFEKLDELAFDKFNCQGKHCFELSDHDIDHILKEDAFTSAQITDDRIEKMESAASETSWGYFFVEGDGDLFTSELERRGIVFDREDIELDDWNSEWKKNYQKIFVTDDLEVVPAWEKENDDASKVFIYPGMGFGTGTHETTFLCLKMFMEIKDEFSPENLCLDFGCGSGILGIATIKKKKMLVDFCDVDAHALENTHQNILLNDYESYCEGHEIVLRERMTFKKYKLVFANILMDILKEESDVIINSVDENGFLVLSGLLVEQENEVLKHYQGFRKVKTLEKNGWIAILLRKN